jgi:mono/diheme cytochrome c family protein
MTVIRTMLCATALMAAATPVMAQALAEPLPGEFIVVEGRVDRGTYTGWRLFQANCQRCHGADGLGTAKAPNLVERIGNYTPRGFATKVITSYRIVPMSPDSGPPEDPAERDALLELVMKRERQQRGQPLMPAWEDDVKVVPHVLDIYAYLNARAYGGLAPGQPRLLPSAGR